MNADLLKAALKLPILERLKLADEIYRSIDRETDDETMAPEVLAEMERRDAAHEADPATGCALEHLEDELFRRQ